MALNRHSKHILNLYIFSFILILAGIGALVGGVLGGISLRNYIGQLGRELAVLQVDNIDDWGDIPGRRDRDLRHQFHIFNVTNPQEVIYGQEPISKMFGPWTFDEERDTDDIIVSEATDAFGNEGEIFTFADHSKFFLSNQPQGMSSELSDRLYVYNHETFAMQYSHRVEDDWLRAIRALSGMINYTSVQLRDELIMEGMRRFSFDDHYSTWQVFSSTRLNVFENIISVPRSTRNNLWQDPIFGFENFENARFWGDVCENRLAFGKDFIRDYFFLPRDAFNDFLQLF